MEMDSNKSQILDGVLMVLVYNQNCTSPCLKLYSTCLKCLVLNAHIPAYLGSRGEDLFLELLSYFVVSANRR